MRGEREALPAPVCPSPGGSPATALFEQKHELSEECSDAGLRGRERDEKGGGDREVERTSLFQIAYSESCETEKN